MSPFEKLFSKMIKPWVIVIYVVLITLSYFYLDKFFVKLFFNLDLRSIALLKGVTHLGSSIIYLTLFFLVALYFRYLRLNTRLETRFWFLWLCVAIPGLICVLIKILLGRARPDLWLTAQYYGFYGLQTDSAFWSFPSGHTTAVMGLAFGLGIVFPRYFYLLLSMAVLVALTRFFLTMHYLSDILAAFYLTVIEVGLMLRFLKRKGWFKPMVCQS